MKCEHCQEPTMRGWIICKRCWQIFMGDVPIPKALPERGAIMTPRAAQEGIKLLREAINAKQ